jgi:hypothetical protein
VERALPIAQKYGGYILDTALNSSLRFDQIGIRTTGVHDVAWAPVVEDPTIVELEFVRFDRRH